MSQQNLYEFEGRRPTVHPDAWIAPTATVVGDVTIEAGASAWYGAVLRADISPIRVGARTNIQDGAILHTGYDAPMEVGVDVTVGHGCVLHCLEIGDNALIGNGAVLLDGARVGPRSVVSAGSVVGPGSEVPTGMIVAGQPAKVLKSVAGSSAEQWLDHNAEFYADLAARHSATARPV
ncbi:gamma carbonic anhydrase family protein [Nocardioides sambongensis]|uniref:gamma carbonic anhydrase family protein n=1 Tax=Nocardioides sambongensis TaxID=2589074 RepID=UPI00112DDDA7|nr:gamma carbonic anhydrase family protein [Nocardioides sambongensis]